MPGKLNKLFFILSLDAYTSLTQIKNKNVIVYYFYSSFSTVSLCILCVSYTLLEKFKSLWNVTVGLF